MRLCISYDNFTMVVSIPFQYHELVTVVQFFFLKQFLTSLTSYFHRRFIYQTQCLNLHRHFCLYTVLHVNKLLSDLRLSDVHCIPPAIPFILLHFSFHQIFLHMCRSAILIPILLPIILYLPFRGSSDGIISLVSDGINSIHFITAKKKTRI